MKNDIALVTGMYTKPYVFNIVTTVTTKSKDYLNDREGQPAFTCSSHLVGTSVLS